MHPTFTSDRPANCAICGMSLVKSGGRCSCGRRRPGQGGKKILYYRNPMNPQVTSPVPMKDEMGMDYVPVYAGTKGSRPIPACTSVPRSSN